VYIDSEQDLLEALQRISSKSVFIIPLIANTTLHPVKAEILSLYIRDGNDEYVFPYKHMESLYSDYTLDQILSGSSGYIYNRSIFYYRNVDVSSFYDLELAHYLETQSSLADMLIDRERFYMRLYNKYVKPNNLVSLTEFIEYARSIVSVFKPSIAGLDFYTNMQELFYKIESSGVAVDFNLFIAHYGSTNSLVGDKAYTKYNFYTSTGRPSNRFGGINFAALNKQDDTRKCFISRFPEGKLIEMDFKAYHPHIIAHLCDYDFGNENVYEHLAKHYFHTQKPTNDQITKAKEYTFNQIYGGINKKYLHIEFFAKTKAYTDLLWEQFREKGYVTSTLSGRELFSDYDSSTDTQLFNYFIQMTETELNAVFLSKLFAKLDFDKTLPVLYTYDSVVFDCKKDYIKELVDKIFDVTTPKFPIVVKIGDNYKEMEYINI